jgi:hypothetical protein
MAARPTTAFGLLLALTAIGICACGGTSSTTATGTAPRATASQTQFIAAATSICAGVHTQEEALKTREESLKNLPAATATPTFVSLVRQATAIAQTAEKRLRALPRPARAEAIEGVLDAYSEEAAEAGKVATAAAHQENTFGQYAAEALARNIALHLASAKRLGMGACFAVE